MEAVIFNSATSDALAASLPVFIFITVLAFLMHTVGRRESVKQYLRKSWFLGSVGILAFLGTVYCGKLSLSSVYLEADMQVSGGQYLGVYINDLKVAPRQLPIVPNVRRAYRIDHIPTTLTYLRIDPTNIASTKVSIYGVTIVSEGHVVRKFGPGDLKSWQLYNLTEIPSDPAAFNIVSSPTADRQGDFLGTDISLSVSNHPAWLLYVTDVFQRDHSYSLIFIFLFLLFLLCGLSKRRGAIEAGLVSAVALVAYPLASLVTKVPGSPPDVTATVGYVNYAGYLKFRDYLISFALLAVCAAFAWVASKFIPVGAAAPLPEETSTGKRRRDWLSGLLPIVIFVWLLALFLPDLSGILKQASHSSFQPTDWDSQYSMFWDYLIHVGSLPFRDFWYPYSGFFVQGLDFPIGGLAIGIQRVLTLWFLYLGLRYVAIQHRRSTILLFLMIFVPIWLGEFPGWFRYLLAIDVILLYVALQDTNRIDWRRRLAFGLAAGFVFFFEPAQLLYAGVGMIVHSLWVIWPKLDFKRNLRANIADFLSLARRRFIVIGIPMLAGILPLLVFFALKGMLGGFINFNLSLSAQSTYGALSASVSDWMQPTLQFDTMFMTVFFVVALSFYAWFRKDYPLDTATIALLVTSVAGFMIIQKHITRPSILHQVQVYPYVCVLLYVFTVWSRRTKAQGVVAAVFVGFVLGVVTYRSLLPSLYQPVINAPDIFSRDYDFFLHKGEETRRMNAAKYEAAKFSGFTAENAVIEVLRKELGWNLQQQIFVPGDDPVFYILLGTSPPYVASTYNASPIREQQRVLQWLHNRRPRFVIWNPSKVYFDMVPHVVRLPLIYQYVVENYHQVKTVAQYQILIENQDHAETDALYWRQQLGTHLDLGHIPRLTAASDYRNCPGNSPSECQSVVFVRFPDSSAPGKVVLTLESPSGPFEVAFDIVAGTRECIIDLDRLWFRSFIGTTPRAAVSVPGAQLRQEPRLRKSDVLY